MPFDALLLSLAVSVVFVGFAAVLAYVDHWSGQPAGSSAQAAMSAPKRRSF